MAAMGRAKRPSPLGLDGIPRWAAPWLRPSGRITQQHSRLSTVLSPSWYCIDHDGAADKIARAVSQIPHAAATIVPYDVQSPATGRRSPTCSRNASPGKWRRCRHRVGKDDQQRVETYQHPEPPPAVIAIDGLLAGHRATVEGRVNQVDDATRDGQTSPGRGHRRRQRRAAGDLPAPATGVPTSSRVRWSGSPERRGRPATVRSPCPIQATASSIRPKRSARPGVGPFGLQNRVEPEDRQPPRELGPNTQTRCADSRRHRWAADRHAATVAKWPTRIPRAAAGRRDR